MKALDLTGKRFGKLTALTWTSTKGGRFWDCVCDCGEHRLVKSGSLTRGDYSCCKTCANPHKDIVVGQKFNEWEVIGFDSKTYADSKNRTVIQVRCSCGCESSVTKERLMSGRSSRCKSCALKGKAGLRKEDSVTGVTTVYGEYRRNAETKKVPFLLTLEDVTSLVFKECYYCGEEPSRKVIRTCHVNGLDRIVPEKGYVEGNVVPCCATCNRMKNIFSYENFIQRCKVIASRH